MNYQIDYQELSNRYLLFKIKISGQNIPVNNL